MYFPTDEKKLSLDDYLGDGIADENLFVVQTQIHLDSVRVSSGGLLNFATDCS